MNPDEHPTHQATDTDDHADAAEAVAKQLLTQAQTITGLRRDLERLAHEVTDTLAAISQRLDDTETKADQAGKVPDGPGQAWCWRTAGHHARQALWEELTDWVDNWLRTRYPLAKKIPPCWSQHPEAVEELTALWLAWQAAYTQPDAPLTAPVDFHDRWLPGLLNRLEHGPHALNCGAKHQDRPAAAYAHGGNTE